MTAPVICLYDWRQRGMALCAVKGNEPNVSSFAGLRHRDVSLPDTSESLKNYIINKWIGDGGQNTILVAIPAGLPKAKITRQIHSILDQLPDDFKRIEKSNPTYKLSGRRVNVNMLSKYLRVLIGKAQHPNEPLWRIGSAVDVSAKHSPKLHYNAVLARKEGSDKKRVLSILTSRALKRSLLISENAARGIFPSYAACPNAVKPDLGELYDRRNSKTLWEQAQRNKVSE